MLGAFLVRFSLISAVFEFHASSTTFMVRVHSSEIVVHGVIVFPLSDSEILQFLLLLSVRDAIASPKM